MCSVIVNINSPEPESARRHRTTEILTSNIINDTYKQLLFTVSQLPRRVTPRLTATIIRVMWQVKNFSKKGQDRGRGLKGTNYYVKNK